VTHDFFFISFYTRTSLKSLVLVLKTYSYQASLSDIFKVFCLSLDPLIVAFYVTHNYLILIASTADSYTYLADALLRHWHVYFFSSAYTTQKHDVKATTR
jgi:hypothetical protein